MLRMVTLFETYLYHQCNIVVVGSIGCQGRTLRLMLWLNYSLEFHD